MNLLSRVGAAVIILAGLAGVAGLSLGLFPRTGLGAFLLVVIGLPLCLAGEALVELSFYARARSWELRAAAFIAFVGIIALLWWWSASHASFVRHNFFG